MKSNTKTFSGNKTGAAQFVKKKLQGLNPDSALITIIGQDISGDYFVSTVIEGSLGDIGRLLEKSSSQVQPSTSADPIPVSSSQ